MVKHQTFDQVKSEKFQTGISHIDLLHLAQALHTLSSSCINMSMCPLSNVQPVTILFIHQFVLCWPQPSQHCLPFQTSPLHQLPSKIPPHWPWFHQVHQRLFFYTPCNLQTQFLLHLPHPSHHYRSGSHICQELSHQLYHNARTHCHAPSNPQPQFPCHLLN